MSLRAAVIDSGVVSNIIKVDDDAVFTNLLVNIEGTKVGIGWLFDGTSFTPPTVPSPPTGVIARVTARQVVEQLTIPERDLLFESSDKKVAGFVSRLMAYATMGIDMEVDATMKSALQYLVSASVIATGRDNQIYSALGGL